MKRTKSYQSVKNQIAEWEKLQQKDNLPASTHSKQDEDHSHDAHEFQHDIKASSTTFSPTNNNPGIEEDDNEFLIGEIKPLGAQTEAFIDEDDLEFHDPQDLDNMGRSITLLSKNDTTPDNNSHPKSSGDIDKTLLEITNALYNDQFAKADTLIEASKDHPEIFKNFNNAKQPIAGIDGKLHRLANRHENLTDKLVRQGEYKLITKIAKIDPTLFKESLENRVEALVQSATSLESRIGTITQSASQSDDKSTNEINLTTKKDTATLKQRDKKKVANVPAESVSQNEVTPDKKTSSYYEYASKKAIQSAAYINHQTSRAYNLATDTAIEAANILKHQTKPLTNSKKRSENRANNELNQVLQILTAPLKDSEAIDMKTKKGEPLIVRAIKNNHKKIVNTLLNYGADPFQIYEVKTDSYNRYETLSIQELEHFKERVGASCIQNQQHSAKKVEESNQLKTTLIQNSKKLVTDDNTANEYIYLTESEQTSIANNTNLELLKDAIKLAKSNSTNDIARIEIILKNAQTTYHTTNIKPDSENLSELLIQISQHANIKANSALEILLTIHKEHPCLDTKKLNQALENSSNRNNHAMENLLVQAGAHTTADLRKAWKEKNYDTLGIILNTSLHIIFDANNPTSKPSDAQRITIRDVLRDMQEQVKSLIKNQKPNNEAETEIQIANIMNAVPTGLKRAFLGTLPLEQNEYPNAIFKVLSKNSTLQGNSILASTEKLDRQNGLFSRLNQIDQNDRTPSPDIHGDAGRVAYYNAVQSDNTNRLQILRDLKKITDNIAKRATAIHFTHYPNNNSASAVAKIEHLSQTIHSNIVNTYQDNLGSLTYNLDPFMPNRSKTPDRYSRNIALHIAEHIHIRDSSSISSPGLKSFDFDQVKIAELFKDQAFMQGPESEILPTIARWNKYHLNNNKNAILISKTPTKDEQPPSNSRNYITKKDHILFQALRKEGIRNTTVNKIVKTRHRSYPKPDLDLLPQPGNLQAEIMKYHLREGNSLAKNSLTTIVINANHSDMINQQSVIKNALKMANHFAQANLLLSNYGINKDLKRDLYKAFENLFRHSHQHSEHALKELLEINQKSRFLNNKDLDHALGYAAKKGNYALVAILIENGAQPEMALKEAFIAKKYDFCRQILDREELMQVPIGNKVIDVRQGKRYIHDLPTRTQTPNIINSNIANDANDVHPSNKQEKPRTRLAQATMEQILNQMGSLAKQRRSLSQNDVKEIEGIISAIPVTLRQEYLTERGVGKRLTETAKAIASSVASSPRYLQEMMVPDLGISATAKRISAASTPQILRQQFQPTQSEGQVQNGKITRNINDDSLLSLATLHHKNALIDAIMQAEGIALTSVRSEDEAKDPIPHKKHLTALQLLQQSQKNQPIPRERTIRDIEEEKDNEIDKNYGPNYMEIGKEQHTKMQTTSTSSTNSHLSALELLHHDIEIG